jgi:hypothetical protein
MPVLAVLYCTVVYCTCIQPLNVCDAAMDTRLRQLQACMTHPQTGYYAGLSTGVVQALCRTLAMWHSLSCPVLLQSLKEPLDEVAYVFRACQRKGTLASLFSGGEWLPVVGWSPAVRYSIQFGTGCNACCPVPQPQYLHAQSRLDAAVQAGGRRKRF